ncbi:hypothetical protein BP6252_10534 [Coleophoma cylindrospora]|uniref:Transport protein USO1 n=1 Tax=Coleophoma cylindrospora TaxID=1849047 RepID=A0A3D8QSU2_9HELO|nr:hypothetical protein BP6252_10534 [Coleophoma cylindrospora]
MSSIERSDSRDSERQLKHQYSASSDYGKAMVPMWDSSDPERAPPPLPMNPSSPVVTSRPNTSSAIQSAHAALTEKARENSYTSNALTKRLEPSPDRAAMKSASHKRMQSLQGGTVRDLSNMIEGSNALTSPTKSPEKVARRPSTPHANKDFVLEKAPEKEERSTTPTSNRDVPKLRPSLRKPERHQSILGENTPPQSATMLALQNMQCKDIDSPLLNITNGSTALVRTPQTFDAISNQILSLTSIATSLQREMSNLTRRSKDNATDLVSLKEATNARDEDIRKSLRELVININEGNHRPSNNYLPSTTGGLFLDNKPHNGSPGSRSVKQFTLPRFPSPNSFESSLDRESMSTPDSTASIALLEKILRDMGTREGQDLLVSRLTEVANRLAEDGMSTAKKLEDLVLFIKENTESQALVAHNLGGDGMGRSRGFSFDEPPRLELDFDKPKSGTMTQRVEALLGSNANKENRRDSVAPRNTDVLNDDVLNIIRTVKDSVAQGGGLTAEVKALVRELRGEVLGMGRELGRKLEQSSNKSMAKDSKAEKERVTRVVEDGLEDLKQHMDSVLREHRRQSASSLAKSNAVDYQEIYNAVRAAVNEKSQASRQPSLAKEDVIEAVKEAWENYKPDIELQHFGLEREELLATLKEGMQEYAPQDTSRDIGGATREEVFEAVVEGLKHFSPPRIEAEASLSRDEILDAVRECLEEFEFPAAPAPPPREDDITKDVQDAVRSCLEEFEFPAAPMQDEVTTRLIVLDAVKEGLHEFPAPQDEAMTRGVVLDAVKEGLNEFELPPQDEATTRGIVLDAVKESLHDFEFPQPQGEATTRVIVLDAIKEGLQEFDFAAINSTAIVPRDIGSSLTREDLFDAVKAGLEDAPAGMSPYGEQQVLGRLQDIIELLRNEFQAVSEEAKQNVAAHGRDTEQLLDATKDGFDRLRGDIETYVDRAAGVDIKDDILEDMHESFSTLRAELETLLSKDSSSSLEAVQGELEHLRETMATSLVRGGGSDKDEILDALREGLDDLRANMDRPRDSNESVLSGTGEILDALHDGLENLRAEVEKLASKPVEPVDMTVNYEILDTLKAGLESVRAEIDSLKENAHNDRAVAAITDGAVVAANVASAPDSLKRNDIENLEVLITQLRIKVEALESMPPPFSPPPQAVPGTVLKEDLAAVEEMIRNVHESVNGINNTARSVDEDGIKREDVEAIETLLRNTKAKIDDMDPEQLVKTDHLNIVEALVRETQDNINEFANNMEDVSKKEDVNIVELLVRDVITGLAEMKERAIKESEDLEKVTKTDVEAVEAVCLDVKTAIEQMVLSDIAGLAAKEDVKNLGEMVKEFKDRIETHADSNAKAFEERQAETVGVGERVSEIRTFLDEFRDAMKEQLDAGYTSVEDVTKFLESLGETINKNATVTDDLKDISELMKEEFEKSNAGVVGAKLESDEKFQQTWDKLDNKFDEKFNELISKYDDAQITADARAKEGEEKNAETQEALLGTKAVAEELRSLIDTLGTTLTESVEKMDEAGKTVFNRVDETFTRVEETHADAKAEHQLTREQVFKAIGAIEGVQDKVVEYHPQMLDSIKEILLIVGQHYEHSKTASTNLETKIAEIPPPPAPIEMPLLPPVEKYDDGQVHEKLDRMVEDGGQVHEKLNKIVDHDAQVHEKLDKLADQDGQVQEKLEKLVEHMNDAGKSFAQLDMLDKIHQQVMQTAAEVSNFVSAQTQRIADDHEDKERAVEEATIALEKRLAQKEHVEATVVGLREEEERLRESISILKAEQEDLAHQKMRLSADVSSLETALHIRREELHAMESRAEGLERRILEGVIDHSRALLMSKATKGKDMMSRKRVSTDSPDRTNSRASNTTHSAVNMAMNGNRSQARPSSTSRRILSLSQITNNVPAGGFKRSHSVKTPSGALRKSSWGGSMSQKYGELNKENLALKESEEDQESEEPEDDAETMRRSSHGTTILTGTGVTDSTIDESTEWTGSEVTGSEMTGSEMTGSEMTGSDYESSEAPTEVGGHIVLYDEGEVA